MPDRIHGQRLAETVRLQDEEPGLYAASRLPGLQAAHPGIRFERVDGFNHYTVVMSAAGGRRVAGVIREELADGS